MSHSLSHSRTTSPSEFATPIHSIHPPFLLLLEYKIEEIPRRTAKRAFLADAYFNAKPRNQTSPEAT